MDIPDGRAETIVKALEQFCEDKGLDTVKVASLASDGASVMVGSLVLVHVCALSMPLTLSRYTVSLMALAAANACKEVPTLTNYSTRSSRCIVSLAVPPYTITP